MKRSEIMSNCVGQVDKLFEGSSLDVLYHDTLDSEVLLMQMVDFEELSM